MQGMWLEGYGYDTNADSVSATTDVIVDALDNWTSLHYFGIEDCNLSEHAVNRLYNHPKLIVLKIN